MQKWDAAVQGWGCRGRLFQQYPPYTVVGGQSWHSSTQEPPGWTAAAARSWPRGPSTGPEQNGARTRGTHGDTAVPCRHAEVRLRGAQGHRRGGLSGCRRGLGPRAPLPAPDAPGRPPAPLSGPDDTFGGWGLGTRKGTPALLMQTPLWQGDCTQPALSVHTVATCQSGARASPHTEASLAAAFGGTEAVPAADWLVSLRASPALEGPGPSVGSSRFLAHGRWPPSGLRELGPLSPEMGRCGCQKGRF